MRVVCLTVLALVACGDDSSAGSGAWTEIRRGTDDVPVKPGTVYEGYGIQ